MLWITSKTLLLHNQNEWFVKHLPCSGRWYVSWHLSICLSVLVCGTYVVHHFNGTELRLRFKNDLFSVNCARNTQVPHGYIVARATLCTIDLCCAPPTCIVHHGAQGGPTILRRRGNPQHFLFSLWSFFIFLMVCCMKCEGAIFNLF